MEEWESQEGQTSSLLLSREEREEKHKTKKRENKRTERLLLTRQAQFGVVSQSRHCSFEKGTSRISQSIKNIHILFSVGIVHPKTMCLPPLRPKSQWRSRTTLGHFFNLNLITKVWPNLSGQERLKNHFVRKKNWNVLCILIGKKKNAKKSNVAEPTWESIGHIVDRASEGSEEEIERKHKRLEMRIEKEEIYKCRLWISSQLVIVFFFFLLKEQHLNRNLFGRSMKGERKQANAEYTREKESVRQWNNEKRIPNSTSMPLFNNPCSLFLSLTMCCKIPTRILPNYSAN